MTKIEDKKQEEVIGGDSYVTGPIINAVVNIIKLIRDAGYDMGSGFRRMAEDEICPLS